MQKQTSVFASMCVLVGVRVGWGVWRRSCFVRAMTGVMSGNHLEEEIWDDSEGAGRGPYSRPLAE